MWNSPNWVIMNSNIKLHDICLHFAIKINFLFTYFSPWYWHISQMSQIRYQHGRNRCHDDARQQLLFSSTTGYHLFFLLCTSDRGLHHESWNHFSTMTDEAQAIHLLRIPTQACYQLQLLWQMATFSVLVYLSKVKILRLSKKNAKFPLQTLRVHLFNAGEITNKYIN